VTRSLPLALAAAALAAILGPAGEALRTATVLPFLLLAPGLSLIPLLRAGERLAELMLGIALSLTLDLLVAQMMLAVGWHPTAAVVALAALCACGVALQEAQAGERRADGT
jgi:hypothetical protein